MALNLTNLRKKRASLVVPVGSEKINLTYKPGLVTNDAITGGGQDAGFLAAVVVEWDILLSPGKPVPIEAQSIKEEIPVDITGLIVRAILTDVTGEDEESGEPEGSFSGG